MRAAQARLDHIAKRALLLLLRSADAQAEMRWAEKRLFEANLLSFDPDHSSPARWAESAIADNPDLVDSLFYLECRDSHPERSQSFENCILSLIPSEGGL